MLIILFINAHAKNIVYLTSGLILIQISSFGYEVNQISVDSVFLNSFN